MHDISIRIAPDGASTISIRSDAGPTPEFIGAVLSEATPVPPAETSGAIPNAKTRFIKIDAKGNAVADSAKKWAAVLDNHSGLIWSAENVGNGEMNHAAALTACAELELAGHSDWRLPTIRELQSLVAFERHEPAIDIAFFPTCRSIWYWSSTLTAWSSDCAWIVNFGSGYASSLHRGNGDAFVRAVRSVPASQ